MTLEELLAQWMNWSPGSGERHKLYDLLDPLDPRHVEAVLSTLESDDFSLHSHPEYVGKWLGEAFANPGLCARLGAFVDRDLYGVADWAVAPATRANTLPLELALDWAGRESSSLFPMHARWALRMSTDPEARERVLELVRSGPESIAWDALCPAFRSALFDEEVLQVVRERIAVEPVRDQQLSFALSWGTHPACTDEQVLLVVDLLEALARDPRHAPTVRGDALRTIVTVASKRAFVERASALLVALQHEAPVMTVFTERQWNGWLDFDEPSRPRAPMPRIAPPVLEREDRPSDAAFLLRLQGWFGKTYDTNLGIAAFTSLLELEPDDAEVRAALVSMLLNEATVFDARDQHAAAFDRARRALAAEPSSLEAAMKAALTGWRAARYEEALACVDRAIVIDGSERNAHLLRGTILLDLARYDEALEAKERALSFAVSPEAENGKALVLAAAGRDEEARALFAKALAALDERVAQKPNDPGAWLHRSVALLGLSRPEDALEAASRSDAIWPRQFGTLRALGKVHLALGQVEPAIERLTAARSSRETAPEASFWLAVAFATRGDATSATAATAALDDARKSPRWALAALGHPLLRGDGA